MNYLCLTNRQSLHFLWLIGWNVAMRIAGSPKVREKAEVGSIDVQGPQQTGGKLTLVLMCCMYRVYTRITTTRRWVV